MPFTNAEVTSVLACLYTKPTRCCIPLPGGGQLCSTADDLDPWKLLQPYIQALMATLNPFMPIFRLLAVVLALIDCVKAIPQSILPPNPGPIINCLAKLISAVVELLKLIPFISLPFTLVAILDCTILFLTALRTTIFRVVARLQTLTIALTSTDPNIAFMAQCELNLLNVQIGVINDILAALGVLFGIVNLLLGLIGLSGAPTSLSVDTGLDPDAAVAPIDAALDVLVTVRSFIPL